MFTVSIYGLYDTVYISIFKYKSKQCKTLQSRTLVLSLEEGNVELLFLFTTPSFLGNLLSNVGGHSSELLCEKT